MSLFCFRGRLLLQDMYIDVDCGSSFFSFLCKTHDHKNSGPCLSLATIMSMWVHSSFKGLISSLKFDCSSEEGSQGNKSVFQSSQSSSKRHQSFVLHILLFLEKSKHPVPNKCPVLNIKYPPLIYQSLSVVNYG